MGDGDHQQAYWVKQLAEGQVAGLPREYVPGQTPFVTEVYASLATGQEDVMGPVHTMPGWLWLLLTGPTTHYGTLLKHVEVTNDWGVTSSRNEASLYASWTRVSSGTGQKYLSDSITV
jgi:hypothetical protein